MSGFGQTHSPVGTATDHIRIVIVLSVILPTTHTAHLEPGTMSEGHVATAWAAFRAVFRNPVVVDEWHGHLSMVPGSWRTVLVQGSSCRR